MNGTKICKITDIIPNSGVGALINGEQCAIFRVKEADGENFYAVSNFCPFGKANVISRGLVGSIQGRTVVASPLYKQHFFLDTGQCLEDDSVYLKTWNVKLENDEIILARSRAVAA